MAEIDVARSRAQLVGGLLVDAQADIDRARTVVDRLLDALDAPHLGCHPIDLTPWSADGAPLGDLRTARRDAEDVVAGGAIRRRQPRLRHVQRRIHRPHPYRSTGPREGNPIMIRRRSIISGALAVPAIVTAVRRPRGGSTSVPTRCKPKPGTYACRTVDDQTADTVEWLRRQGVMASAVGGGVVVTIRGRRFGAPRGWVIVVRQGDREAAIVDPAGFAVLMQRA